MIFTGKNLMLVQEAVVWAIDAVHNEIAICPDVIMYANEIEDLEDHKSQLQHLLARITTSLRKESLK